MSAKKGNVKLKIDLLENGLDFIQKGIEELFADNLELRDYRGPSNRSALNYKYGILHLFSGFLLLLKERLRQHLEESIYKGSIKDVREKLRHGNPLKTIDFDEILDRLSLGPKIDFTDDEMKTLRRMQNFRNDFEHHKLEIDPYELWANIVNFLVITDKFLVSHLNVRLESFIAESTWREKLRSMEEVWRQVETRLIEEWANEIAVKEALFRKSRKRILKEIQSSEQEGEEGFIQCPNCFQFTLIADGDYEGICTHKGCDNSSPVANCNRCGQPTTGFYWDEPWCEDCVSYFSHLMGKDD